MPKLLVLGCSLSDYTRVNKPWGELLADTLNYEYIHEAAGCGSNWRMWRRAFTLVENNTITPSDTVIIQYTEVIRREFWSPYQTEARPLSGSNNKSFLTEAYDGGTIIRYKLDSHTFGDYVEPEKKFQKQYNHFVNLKFELEQFYMMHKMFQCFMQQQGFENLYFLKGGGYGPLESADDLIPFYQKNWIDGSKCLVWHLPKDHLHMDQRGHRELASRVHKYIK